MPLPAFVWSALSLSMYSCSSYFQTRLRWLYRNQFNIRNLFCLLVASPLPQYFTKCSCRRIPVHILFVTFNNNNNTCTFIAVSLCWQQGSLVFWDIELGKPIRLVKLGDSDSSVFVQQMALLDGAVACDYGCEIRVVRFPRNSGSSSKTSSWQSRVERGEAALVVYLVFQLCDSSAYHRLQYFLDRK